MHAVLLDRDGTLSLTGGYCHPADFRFAPWAGEAIRLLNQHGLPVAVVTSQTGIAHGKFTIEELHECFLRMIDELAQANAYVSAIYYCPHITPAKVTAYAIDCPYHKPNPGMLLRAAYDLDVKIEHCFMVGDSGKSDMGAGSAAGCQTVLVRTGWGESSLHEYRHDWADIEPDQVFENLLEAAQWIISVTQPQPLVERIYTEIIQL
ncbi:MAG: HAD-IIIA family hydrolase [Caldilineaceae bacterium]